MRPSKYASILKSTNRAIGWLKPGGPAVVDNTYLESTYSETYPNISQDEAGLQKLFVQFRFPEEFSAMHRRSARAQSTRPAN
jgi:phosphoketolase